MSHRTIPSPKVYCIYILSTAFLPKISFVLPQVPIGAGQLKYSQPLIDLSKKTIYSNKVKDWIRRTVQ